jgi:hypothetical protein
VVQHLCCQSWPLNQESGQMHQYNVRAPVKRIAIDVARSFPWRDQGNWYLLITLDYITKWLEAYAIPNQEASTMADVLVTNFFCHFGILLELHRGQGYNFKSRLMQEVLLRVNKTHTSAPPPPPPRGGGGQSDNMVEPYIRMVEEHLQKVTTSGFTPGSLVFGRELCPTACCFGHPQHWMTHNRSCRKFGRPSTRHTKLCPPAPEAGHWPDENSLQQTGQLCRLPGGQQCLALSPNSHKGEIYQVPNLTGGPIQGSHPDKLCGIQDPSELLIEVDGGTPGLAGTLSGNRSGWVALRREQWKQLERNHHANQARGRKVRPIADVTSPVLRKEEIEVHL